MNTFKAVLPDGVEITRDEYVALCAERNVYAFLTQKIDEDNPAWAMIDDLLEEASDLKDEIEDTFAFRNKWSF